jgi:hypothetical protein
MSYYCNECGVFPIEGTRFHCTVCPDFDECGECRVKERHDPSHAWIEAQEEKRVLSSDEAFVTEIIGKVAKCFGHTGSSLNKTSGTLVESMCTEEKGFLGLLALSHTLDLKEDDLGCVMRTVQDLKDLHESYPNGKHVPYCNFGFGQGGQECPRCAFEFMHWMLFMRVAAGILDVNALAQVLAFKSKGSVKWTELDTRSMQEFWLTLTASECAAFKKRADAIAAHLDSLVIEWE